MSKPRTAAGYDREHVTKVREACLYLATKLGDLLEELVIVGGLVPSLLIDQTSDRIEKHVGTLDLDVGMQVAILDNRRYEAMTERLRAAGFGPDTNEKGSPTRQRWKIDGPPKVTLDFLVPPSREGDRGGGLRDIEADFAAIIAPGLRLAFLDSATVSLAGRTIRGEQARRDVKVSGAGAFVAMKALALRGRGENKDAYDLVYVLRNFGTGPVDTSPRLRPLMSEREAQEALRVLTEEFETVGHVAATSGRVSPRWTQRGSSGRCLGRSSRPTGGAHLTKSPPLTTGSGRRVYAGRGASRPAVPPDRPRRHSRPRPRSRLNVPVPPRLQNLSTNRVDSGGRAGTREELSTAKKRKDLRTLATKNERHRQLGKGRSLGFKSSRPDYFSGRAGERQAGRRPGCRTAHGHPPQRTAPRCINCVLKVPQ
jgi:hypothetical protein